MLREQCEPEQEPEQVGEDHPLVREMQPQAGQARALLEARERELVDDDRGEPDQRDPERVVMEKRDAEQRQREQDEIDGDSEKLRHDHFTCVAGTIAFA